MKICQDEECPNYDELEDNACNTFKQVSECPTPDYLTTDSADGAEVPCSEGLSCRDEIVEKLIKLAADMVTRQGFPSEFVEDWPIPKSTPQKTVNEIERNMEIIQKKMATWSYAVRQIANELHRAI
jgi:hypothetical protein